MITLAIIGLIYIPIPLSLLLNVIRTHVEGSLPFLSPLIVHHWSRECSLLLALLRNNLDASPTTISYIFVILWEHLYGMRLPRNNRNGIIDSTTYCCSCWTTTCLNFLTQRCQRLMLHTVFQYWTISGERKGKEPSTWVQTTFNRRDSEICM